MVLPSGVTAIWVGSGPTRIGLPGVLVAMLIGVNVPLNVLATYANRAAAAVGGPLPPEPDAPNASVAVPIKAAAVAVALAPASIRRRRIRPAALTAPSIGCEPNPGSPPSIACRINRRNDSSSMSRSFLSHSVSHRQVEQGVAQHGAKLRQRP